MKKNKFLEELKKIAPNIAITVTRTIDDFPPKWDGDGPDPKTKGFWPYDVTVTAKAIEWGEIVEGSDCIGGCYYRKPTANRPGESIGDVHGYLADLVLGALDKLEPKLSSAALVAQHTKAKFAAMSEQIK